MTFDDLVRDHVEAMLREKARCAEVAWMQAIALHSPNMLHRLFNALQEGDAAGVGPFPASWTVNGWVDYGERRTPADVADRIARALSQGGGR